MKKIIVFMLVSMLVVSGCSQKARAVDRQEVNAVEFTEDGQVIINDLQEEVKPIIEVSQESEKEEEIASNREDDDEVKDLDKKVLIETKVDKNNLKPVNNRGSIVSGTNTSMEELQLKIQEYQKQGLTGPEIADKPKKEGFDINFQMQNGERP